MMETNLYIPPMTKLYQELSSRDEYYAFMNFNTRITQ